jgi:hypothetical protein
MTSRRARPAAAARAAPLTERPPELGDLTVGITGRRDLGPDLRTELFVRARCQQLLEHLGALATAQGSGLVAMSSLAVGADAAFADAALALGVPLVGVVPAGMPEEDKASPRFQQMLGWCREVHRLRKRARSGGPYLDGARWVVQNCDVLIAVWSGDRDPVWQIVDYARRQHRLVLCVDPTAAPTTDHGPA